MTGWIILAVIVGILLLINLLPVGAYCRYDGESLIQLCIGPIRITLFPKKTKSRKQQEKADTKKAKKKSAKAQKKKDKKETSLVQKKPKKKKPGTEMVKEALPDKIAGLIPFVQLVTEFLGKFRRKFLIKKLYLHIKLAGNDPAKLGVNTGRAWAAIATAMPILKSRFRIRSSDVQVSPDFVGDKTDISVILHIRLIVGAVILLALRYGLRGLKLYLNRKKQQKMKKAVQQ